MCDLSSIFGGQQTVPQTQNTFQTYGQNANQQQQQSSLQGYSANPMAINLANTLTPWATAIGTGAIPTPPPLQIADLTANQQQAIGEAVQIVDLDHAVAVE